MAQRIIIQPPPMQQFQRLPALLLAIMRMPNLQRIGMQHPPIRWVRLGGALGVVSEYPFNLAPAQLFNRTQKIDVVAFHHVINNRMPMVPPATPAIPAPPIGMVGVNTETINTPAKWAWAAPFAGFTIGYAVQWCCAPISAIISTVLRLIVSASMLLYRRFGIVPQRGYDFFFRLALGVNGGRIVPERPTWVLPPNSTSVAYSAMRLPIHAFGSLP